MAENRHAQFSTVLIGSLFSILVLSCEKHESIEMRDPFLDSFKGKSIKKVVSFESKDMRLADTIFFDEQGNIIEKRQYGLTLKTAYDSAGFPTRMLFLNDAPYNFIIDYRVDKTHSRITQRWRTIRTMDWNFRESDINKTSFNVVTFEYDNGVITAKKDSLANLTTRYFYNDEGKLIRQEIIDDDGELSKSIVYEYAPDRKLVSIYAKLSQVDLYRHHFTNGLLDSTEYLHPSDLYTRKYKYEFN